MKVAYIYALDCPFTLEPMYVGKTKNPLYVRLKQHISTSKEANRFINIWITKLNELGYSPIIRLLETCPNSMWQECERKWIKDLSKKHELLNMDEGGISIKYSPVGYSDSLIKLNSKQYLQKVDEINNRTIMSYLAAEQAKGIELTRSQQVAFNVITTFINGKVYQPEEEITSPLRIDPSNKRSFTLAGPAGTGKSTLVSRIIGATKNKRTAVAAPTHKAKKVIENFTGIKGETIQSLLGLRLSVDISEFNPNQKEFEPMAEPALSKYSVVYVDEGSMVNEKLHNMLIEQAEIARCLLIFVGDRCQLPPVNETHSKCFDNTNYVELVDIVRQKDTNPVLYLCDISRRDIDESSNEIIRFINQNPVNVNIGGEGYQKYTSSNQIDIDTFKANIIKDFTLNDIQDIKIMAWTNERVSQYNKFVRGKLFAGKPMITVGDLLMSYTTVKGEEIGQDNILTNSEEYYVESVAEQNNQWNVPCFICKVNNLTTKRSSYINIVHPDGYEKYRLEHDNLVAKAKSAGGKGWAKYYEFRGQTLLLESLKMPGGKTINRDIDYAYAITVHKSQGSTYNYTYVDVADIMKNRTTKEMKQLLYVAFSRCRIKATLVI